MTKAIYKTNALRHGGLFKVEECLTPGGRRFFRLATGSGGAQCLDTALAAAMRPRQRGGREWNCAYTDRVERWFYCKGNAP